MYGRTKKLSTGQAFVNGEIVEFSPVEVLKSFPEARSKKALKGATAWILVKSPARLLPNRQMKNWAYQATKGTRVGSPPRIPRFSI
jgi:hypothetical protein